MKLYVVRHGQTVWNLQHKIQGTADIELTELGINEAYELQKLVRDINIDVAISSPLLRALSTAEILVDNRLPVFIDDRLIERNWGDNEGKSLDEVDRWYCWDVTLNIEDNNIEKIQDFMKRVSDFIEEIKINFHNQKVLIVTHSAVIRVIHYLLGSIPEDGNLSRMDIPNLRILEYEI
jgi:broad specificity phosphatase PhoE